MELPGGLRWAWAPCSWQQVRLRWATLPRALAWLDTRRNVSQGQPEAPGHLLRDSRRLLGTCARPGHHARLPPVFPRGQPRPMGVGLDSLSPDCLGRPGRGLGRSFCHRLTVSSLAPHVSALSASRPGAAFLVFECPGSAAATEPGQALGEGGSNRRTWRLPHGWALPLLRMRKAVCPFTGGEVHAWATLGLQRTWRTSKD